MSRIAFSLIFVCSAVLLKAQHHGIGSPDKPSVHGMLVFGKEVIYASHLPLFHTPHDYQIILELQLDKISKQKFIKDQQLYPEFTTYTIEPERFVLPDMIAKPRPFKVNLYRGHFERGGIKIADSITVQIKRVIFFKRFNPVDKKDTVARFILFGNAKEQFAVHVITNKPDFEQIIQVQTSPSAFVRNEQHAFVLLNENANEPVGVSGNAVEVKDFAKKEKLVLLKQIYLEFDDLR